MDLDQRLERLEMRQEALLPAIHGLAAIMGRTRDLVTE